MLPITAHQIRRLTRDRRLLVRLLEELGRRRYGSSFRVEGDACRCWNHHDRRPSGSIHLSRDGRAYLYTCHACDWNRLNPQDRKATGDVITVLRAAMAGSGHSLGFEDAFRWLQRYREKAVDLQATSALPLFVRPQKLAPDPAMIAKAQAHLPVAQAALQGNPMVQERL